MIACKVAIGEFWSWSSVAQSAAQERYQRGCERSAALDKALTQVNDELEERKRREQELQGQHDELVNTLAGVQAELAEATSTEANCERDAAEAQSKIADKEKLVEKLHEDLARAKTDHAEQLVASKQELEAAQQKAEEGNKVGVRGICAQ